MPVNYIDQENFYIILTVDDSEKLVPLLTLPRRKKRRDKQTLEFEKIGIHFDKSKYAEKQAEYGLLPLQTVVQLVNEVTPNDFYREPGEHLWQPCFLHKKLVEKALEQGLVKQIERERVVTESYDLVVTEVFYEPQTFAALPNHTEGGAND